MMLPWWAMLYLCWWCDECGNKNETWRGRCRRCGEEREAATPRDRDGAES